MRQHQQELDRVERAGELVEQMDSVGVSPSTLAEMIGRHVDTVKSWRAGRTAPHRESEYRTASALAALDDRRFSAALFPPLCRIRPLQEPGGKRVETVLACPECDSPAVYANGTGLVASSTEPRWRCDDCRAKFDDAVERQRYSVMSSSSLSGVARQLDEMDPDELSAP